MGLVPREAAMRKGFHAILFETQPGELAELWERLDARGIPSRCLPISTPHDEELPTGPAAAVLRLEAHIGPGIARPWQPLGLPLLALCGEHDHWSISLAGAIGADDLALLPLDEAELCRRLERLADLAAWRAEGTRRQAFLASFLPGGGWDPGPAPARLRVCLVGPPSAVQVEVANALPPATLSHVADPTDLGAALASFPPDLVAVTAPKALAPTLDALAGIPQPQLLAVHHGSLSACELPPPIDHVALPAPPGVLRLRLLLGLRCAEARRRLRLPLAGFLVDGPSSLLTGDALLAYLSLPDAAAEHAFAAFVPAEPETAIRALGPAGLGRLIGELGARLARATRAEDLAAHLGGARFTLAVRASGRRAVEAVRTRVALELERAILHDAFHMVSAAEPGPSPGDPARRLAGLLRALGPSSLAA
jgi:hypothetical protein